MEQKNIKPNQLLIHTLKDKKNWAMLTLAILLVTVIIIPMLVRSTIGYESGIHEGFVGVGLFFVVLIVLVNCLIDFNYLHDARKFGYYASKPMSAIKRINQIIISNFMFGMTFILMLFVVSIINGHDLSMYYIIPIAWMSILILLSALGSLLSGNTIIAAITTIFNFLLPLVFLGVVYFAVTVVSDITIGFSVNQIMDFILTNIYKLELIYMVEYAETFSFMFFIVLLIECLLIYSVIRWTLTHRKNERIGEFIIFRGYKYFVALMFSVLVPYLFTSMFDTHDFLMKLITFIILGSLTYYVALVILDKSFKLKKVAFKLLIGFMSLFIIIVSVAGFSVKTIEKNLPEMDAVEKVFLSNSNGFYMGEWPKQEYVGLGSITGNKIETYNLPTYQSDDAIRKIITLHEALIENPETGYYGYFNVVYFLKDGSVMKRFYELRPTGGVVNQDFEAALNDLVRTDGNKEVMFPFIYDEKVRAKYSSITLNVQSNFDSYDQFLSKEEIELFVIAMKKDIDFYFENAEFGSYDYGFNNNEFYFQHQLGIYDEDIKDDTTYIQPINGTNRLKGYNIPHYFDHTRDFLKTITKEQSN